MPRDSVDYNIHFLAAVMPCIAEFTPSLYYISEHEDLRPSYMVILSFNES